MDDLSKKYAVVTVISSHRIRYAVPMDELQKLNEDYVVNSRWALDCVVSEDVDEFSQMHLGEQIVDIYEMNEDEILDLFDRDNDYLKEWSKEQKINYIRDWKSKV